MKTIATVQMELEKVTKGAVRYSNTSLKEDSPVTVIYLRKSGLTEPYPTIIELTISVK